MIENLEVIEHLMFHKSIVDEGDRAERIDRYMGMLSEDEGDEVILDQVDASIKAAFDLVLQHDMDPWSIDLLSFTRMYSEKARNDEIDFIVAGKLVYMAWSILRMQSEGVLNHHDPPQEGYFEDWDMGALDGFETGLPEDLIRIPGDLEMPSVVRHPSVRPVSLIELLDAFEDARTEAEISLERRRARESNRKRGDDFDDKAHDEDHERDVEEVWGRIQRCGAGPIKFHDLCDGTIDDTIMAFVSILHLARDGRLEVWQEDIPYGEISVEVRMAWDIGTIEDAKEALIPQTIVVDDRDMVI